MSKPSLVAPSTKPQSRMAPPGTLSKGKNSAMSSCSEIAATIEEFGMGDRVWVGGTKEGIITFLGKTQFAEGEWAGIRLDEPNGKNNGSVNGVNYFECPDKYGLFSRLSNLKHEPGSMTASTTNLSMTSSTSDIHKSILNTPIAGQNNNNATPTATPVVPVASAGPHPSGLRVGERILVSGNRLGTLRYLGGTDFAKGDWAGIELDDSSGKNDGSVGGKRYFACKPNYGLFAPVHKVSKPGAGPVPPSARKASISGLKPPGFTSRSGSQESLCSVSSNVSSASRQRVRLGVTALAGNGQDEAPPEIKSYNNSYNPVIYGERRATPKSSSSADLGRMRSNKPLFRSFEKPTVASTARRPSVTTPTPSKPVGSNPMTALQKVVKEKEQHIEQLLKEREMERSDIARVTMQAEEAENQFVAMKNYSSEMGDKLRQLTDKVELLEKEKVSLHVKFEEEKRKVEDLQFQMEEENIDKSTLETKTEEDESKIFELEESLATERDSRETLERQTTQLKESYETEKKRCHEAEESAVAYLERMELLQSQVAGFESQLKQATEKIKDESTKQLLIAKDEELENYRRQLTESESKLLQTENRLANLEEENSTAQVKRDKQETTIKSLQADLAALESTRNELTAKVEQIESERRRLEDQVASQEAKNRNLGEQKEKLEAEFADVMRNSGDSSQQLSALNDQIRIKTQELQNMQDESANSQQQIKRLQEELTLEVTKREEQLKILTEKNSTKTRELEETLAEMTSELDSIKKRVTRTEEGFTQEKASIISAHEATVAQLTNQITARQEELTNQKAVMDEATLRFDQATEELEENKAEISRLEQLLRKTESEKVEMIQGKRKLTEERDSLAATLKTNQDEMVTLRDQLVQLTTDREAAITDKHAAQREHTEVKARRDEVEMRLEKVTAEKTSIEERLIRLESELEERKATADLSAQEKTAQIEVELVQLTRSLEECRVYISKVECEKRDNISEIERLRAGMGEYMELQKEKEDLQFNLESVRERISDLQANGNQSIRQLEEKSEELRLVQERLIKTNNEHENLQDSHKRIVQDLEREKRTLEDKLRRGERQLEEIEKKAKTNGLSDGDSSRLHDAKENAEYQIDFLNSIIVELQAKNLDLENKIKVLTDTESHNGDSSSPAPTTPRVLSQRVYCDICEEFDQHDTEDCPTQQSFSVEDGPEHSKHHAERGQNRPYCETCEMFGHNTGDCNDQETF